MQTKTIIDLVASVLSRFKQSLVAHYCSVIVAFSINYFPFSCLLMVLLSVLLLVETTVARQRYGES